MAKVAKKGGRKSQEPVTRDYTIHLHKLLQKIQFKKRAPRAIREIRKFAAKAMTTKDVRIDTKLNKFIWSNGVRNVATRVRVRMSRKRNEDEEAKELSDSSTQHTATRRAPSEGGEADKMSDDEEEDLWGDFDDDKVDSGIALSANLSEMVEIVRTDKPSAAAPAPVVAPIPLTWQPPQFSGLANSDPVNKNAQPGSVAQPVVPWNTAGPQAAAAGPGKSMWD